MGEQVLEFGTELRSWAAQTFEAELEIGVEIQAATRIIDQFDDTLFRV